jgi:hypothetical protein
VCLSIEFPEFCTSQSRRHGRLDSSRICESMPGSK